MLTEDKCKQKLLTLGVASSGALVDHPRSHHLFKDKSLIANLERTIPASEQRKAGQSKVAWLLRKEKGQAPVDNFTFQNKCRQFYISKQIQTILHFKTNSDNFTFQNKCMHLKCDIPLQ